MTIHKADQEIAQNLANTSDLKNDMKNVIIKNIDEVIQKGLPVNKPGQPVKSTQHEALDMSGLKKLMEGKVVTLTGRPPRPVEKKDIVDFLTKEVGVSQISEKLSSATKVLVYSRQQPTDLREKAEKLSIPVIPYEALGLNESNFPEAFSRGEKEPGQFDLRMKDQKASVETELKKTDDGQDVEKHLSYLAGECELEQGQDLGEGKSFTAPQSENATPSIQVPQNEEGKIAMEDADLKAKLAYLAAEDVPENQGQDLGEGGLEKPKTENATPSVKIPQAEGKTASLDDSEVDELNKLFDMIHFSSEKEADHGKSDFDPSNPEPGFDPSKGSKTASQYPLDEFLREHSIFLTLKYSPQKDEWSFVLQGPDAQSTATESGHPSLEDALHFVEENLKKIDPSYQGTASLKTASAVDPQALESSLKAAGVSEITIKFNEGSWNINALAPNGISLKDTYGNLQAGIDHLTNFAKKLSPTSAPQAAQKQAANETPSVKIPQNEEGKTAKDLSTLKSMLQGKIVVLTGIPPRPLQKKEVAEYLINKVGVKAVEPAFTARTQVVIYNKEQDTSKRQKAEAAGLTTMAYEELEMHDPNSTLPYHREKKSIDATAGAMKDLYLQLLEKGFSKEQLSKYMEDLAKNPNAPEPQPKKTAGIMDEINKKKQQLQSPQPQNPQAPSKPMDPALPDLASYVDPSEISKIQKELPKIKEYILSGQLHHDMDIAQPSMVSNGQYHPANMYMMVVKKLFPGQQYNSGVGRYLQLLFGSEDQTHWNWLDNKKMDNYFESFLFPRLDKVSQAQTPFTPTDPK